MGLGKRTRKYLKHRVKKSRFTRNKNNIKQGGNRRIKRTLNKTRKIGGANNNSGKNNNGNNNNGKNNNGNNNNGKNNNGNNNGGENEEILCLISEKTLRRTKKMTKLKNKSSIISFKLSKNETEPKIELTDDNNGLQTAVVEGQHNHVLDIRINNVEDNQELNEYTLITLEFFYSWHDLRNRSGFFRSNKKRVDNCSFSMEFYGTKKLYDILTNENENKNKTYKLILYILKRYKIENATNTRSAKKIHTFIENNDLIEKLENKIKEIEKKHKITPDKNEEMANEQMRNEEMANEQMRNEEEENEEDASPNMTTSTVTTEAAMEKNNKQPLTEDELRNTIEKGQTTNSNLNAKGGSKKRKRTRKRARRRR